SNPAQRSEVVHNDTTTSSPKCHRIADAQVGGEMSWGTLSRFSNLAVIGWKYPPQAWWPELPGKAGEYNPQMAKPFKKVCRACRKVEVQGRLKPGRRLAAEPSGRVMGGPVASRSS